MPCMVVVVGKHRAWPPNTWYSSETGKGDPAFKPAPMPTGRHYLAAARLAENVIAAVGGLRTQRRDSSHKRGLRRKHQHVDYQSFYAHHSV